MELRHYCTTGHAPTVLRVSRLADGDRCWNKAEQRIRMKGLHTYQKQKCDPGPRNLLLRLCRFRWGWLL